MVRPIQGPTGGSNSDSPIDPAIVAEQLQQMQQFANVINNSSQNDSDELKKILNEASNLCNALTLSRPDLKKKIAKLEQEIEDLQNKIAQLGNTATSLVQALKQR